MAHLGHLHLGEAPAVHHARILHRLAEHAERIVQTPLCLVQHMRACGKSNISISLHVLLDLAAQLRLEESQTAPLKQSTGSFDRWGLTY